MNFGLDLPVEASDPRGGIVTVRAIDDTTYERTIMFPDGSVDITNFRDVSTWPRTWGDDDGETAIGADAAARRLAEIAAGKLLYCHEAGAWFV